MKRLAIVLLTLLAVPALADPDPDDTTDQPAKPKKKPKKKKKAKPKKKQEDKPVEIEIEDPTAKPPPVAPVGVDASTSVDTPADPNAAAMAPAEAAKVSNPTPIELSKRPLVLQPGRFDFGGYLAIPRGPDYTSTTSNAPVGKWIGLVLRGEYGVIDKLSLGLQIDLAPITSDVAATDTAPSKIGGVNAQLKYSLLDGLRAAEKDPMQLAAHVEVGLLKRGAPALGPYSFPLYGPDLEPAFALGVQFQKTAVDDKLAVIVDPHLFFQASGHATIDNGMQALEALITIQVPVFVGYQVLPNGSLGVRTGIYTGQKVSFSPDDGLAIPLIAEGVYTVMSNHLDLGLDLGLGNVTAPKGSGPLETFVLGLFATYRTK